MKWCLFCYVIAGEEIENHLLELSSAFIGKPRAEPTLCLCYMVLLS